MQVRVLCLVLLSVCIVDARRAILDTDIHGVHGHLGASVREAASVSISTKMVTKDKIWKKLFAFTQKKFLTNPRSSLLHSKNISAEAPSLSSSCYSVCSQHNVKGMMRPFLQEVKAAWAKDNPFEKVAVMLLDQGEHNKDTLDGLRPSIKALVISVVDAMFDSMLENADAWGCMGAHKSDCVLDKTTAPHGMNSVVDIMIDEWAEYAPCLVKSCRDAFNPSKKWAVEIATLGLEIAWWSKLAGVDTDYLEDGDQDVANLCSIINENRCYMDHYPQCLPNTQMVQEYENMPGIKDVCRATAIKGGTARVGTGLLWVSVAFLILLAM